VFSAHSALGSIIGGAIGDALGGLLERGNLSLSDDTQLTLATCEAISETGSADPAAIASSMLRWYRARRVSGIGSATLKALRDLDGGAHWALAGARGEMAAGNGAAMRIAPVAFVLDPAVSEHRTTLRDVCRITHHNDEAYIGGLAITVAIRGTGADSMCPLTTVAEQLPDSRVRDRLLEVANLPPGVAIDHVAARFGASGYVVDTVPLALLLAERMAQAGFLSPLQQAARLSGDMDTICSIAGQVAGAQLGFARLPAEMLALEPVASSLPIARRFASTVGDAG
jgi:ADP-ribosylglycohydrolase